MRRALIPFGETEVAVLQVLWELGEASVAEVHERLGEDRAYTTVMTVMRNLAEKGYLTYRQEGRMYIYRPVVSPQAFKAHILKQLLQKVFGGSPMELVQTLVSEETLSPAEIQQLRTLIQHMEEGDVTT